MNRLDLGQTINTLANLGVLAGIVFLAIEVSQNQASLEEANTINLLEARGDTLASFIGRGYVIVQDEDLSRIELMGNRGDELNELDAKRYQDLCGGLIWITASTYERWKALAVESRARASAQTLKRSISQNPGLRRCWEGLREAVTLWGFEDFISEVESGSGDRSP